MHKSKQSMLMRRTGYLKKGVDLVIQYLFEQSFDNEASCCDLDIRLKKIERKLKIRSS